MSAQGGAMRGKLDAELGRIDVVAPGWDDLWRLQVGSAADTVSRLFDIRLTLLPAGVDDQTVRELVLRHCSTGSPAAQRWTDRLELLQQMQAAEKMRRFVPNYRAQDDAGRWPAKCSLLGTYEQMGPSDLADSAEFWRQVVEQRGGLRLDGIRVRANERLCALSLVKRFAWCARSLLQPGVQARNGDHRRHYDDTATVAAAAWLKKVQNAGIDLKPEEIIDKGRDWSGQWLHWKTPTEDADELECPKDLFERIEEARRDCGPPAIYYAILMLDGDKMGDAFRKAAGPEAHQKLSRGISEFARERVSKIVDGRDGRLIYCGGDDVLAMLPTAGAVQCSLEISQAFIEVWQKHGLNEYGDGTVSAGLAIVHYKEDLRFAMQTARKAEKAAKAAGRNRLVLTVCRRSGQHSVATCPWDFVPRLTNLVNVFLDDQQEGSGISDRWAYHLAAELPTLEILSDADAMAAEITRQIKRSEKATRERLHAGDTLATAFPEYRRRLMKTPPKPSPKTPGQIPPDHSKCRHSETAGSHEAQIRRDFVTLCQSASFLARGRDE